jgi:hypothetical protein
MAGCSHNRKKISFSVVIVRGIGDTFSLEKNNPALIIFPHPSAPTGDPGREKMRGGQDRS